MLYMMADPPEVAGFTSTMGSDREINIKNSGSNIPVRITRTGTTKLTLEIDYRD